MRKVKKCFMYLLMCMMLMTVTTTVTSTNVKAYGETKTVSKRWVKQKVNKKTKYVKLKKKAKKTIVKTTKKAKPRYIKSYSGVKLNKLGSTWETGTYFDTKVTKKYYKKGSKKVKVYTYISRKILVERLQYYDN